MVKAQLKERLTYTVDNIRGKLLDPNGFPFILFGSYIYGVTTEVERAVPEAEIPFGITRKSVFRVLMKQCCNLHRDELDWSLSQ